MNKIIRVHDYYLAYELTKLPVVEGFVQLAIEYGAPPLEGKAEQVTVVPIHLKGKSLVLGSGKNLKNIFFANNKESSIGKGVFLKGRHGVKIADMSGSLSIKVDYSYHDFPFQDSRIDSNRNNG